MLQNPIADAFGLFVYLLVMGGLGEISDRRANPRS